RTTRDSLRDTLRQLGDATHVVGLVLNEVDFARGGSEAGYARYGYDSYGTTDEQPNAAD
ncbi:MAG: hypothetical protein H5U40_17665, partial [Polyangiaceae bacterium]|nr:hypothetical protein [Polyangiaceae bacterium]